MDHPFRSAAFGGFHRQDVLNYLEAASQEHSRQTQELQEKLTELEEQLNQCAQREAADSEELVRLRQTLEEQGARAEESEADAGRLRGQRDTLLVQEQARESELQELRRRVAELEATENRLRPDAEAYAAVKERAAGVELDAHRRAQQTVDEADRQAEALRHKLAQWLSRVSRDYADLRCQVDATVSHAAEELRRVDAALGEISSLMEGQGYALEELGRTAAEPGQERGFSLAPLSED